MDGGLHYSHHGVLAGQSAVALSGSLSELRFGSGDTSGSLSEHRFGGSDDSDTFSECNSDRSGEDPSTPVSGAGNGGFGTGAQLQRLLFCATAASDKSDEVIASLVAVLSSASATVDELRLAAMELRLLAKHNPANRVRIAEAGAVPVFVALISHPDPQLQEHGVTALLNLSICDENKSVIVEAGAVRPLVWALRSGATPATRENAAVALLRLSQLDAATASAIGRAGAIPPLLTLLETAGSRGKKDAATTLFSLCTVCLGNCRRAVEAGAVHPLLEIMADPDSGMVDKAAHILHALLVLPEARTKAVEEGGVPVLVEMVESGTLRQKEIATLSLLLICENSANYRGMVAREGAIPALVALSQSAAAKPRLKTKAEALVQLLRKPRSGSSVRSSRCHSPE